MGHRLKEPSRVMAPLVVNAEKSVGLLGASAGLTALTGARTPVAWSKSLVQDLSCVTDRLGCPPSNC